MKKDSVYQKQAQASESDLDISEQVILQEFLNTFSESEVDSDDDVNIVAVKDICANCRHPPKKGGELKRCSRCQTTRYCSVDCQRKDLDFHQFACAVVNRKLTFYHI